MKRKIRMRQSLSVSEIGEDDKDTDENSRKLFWRAFRKTENSDGIHNKC